MATVTDRGRTPKDHMAYLGHATVLLELGGVRLLTDPVLRARLGHLRRQGPAPAPPRDLDAVLISHLHYDHLDLPSLRALEDRPRLVVPHGAGGFLRRRGHSNVTELAPGDSIDVGTARITATPAVHDARRRPFGGPVAAPVGFQIETDGCRAYFAGDTDVFDGMADLAATSTSRCCPSGAGAPRWARGISTPAAPPAWRRSCSRGWRCRSTGAPCSRSGCPGAGPSSCTTLRASSPLRWRRWRPMWRCA